MAMPRALLPEWRSAGHVVARTRQCADGRRRDRGELAELVARPLWIRRPDHHLAGGPTDDAELPADEMAERLGGRVAEPARLVAALLLGRMGRHGVRHDGLEIDLGWRWIVGIDLLVQLGHAELTDAVADGMVHDRPQCGAPSVDA